MLLWWCDTSSKWWKSKETHEIKQKHECRQAFTQHLLVTTHNLAVKPQYLPPSVKHVCKWMAYKFYINSLIEIDLYQSADISLRYLTYFIFLLHILAWPINVYGGAESGTSLGSPGMLLNVTDTENETWKFLFSLQFESKYFLLANKQTNKNFFFNCA